MTLKLNILHLPTGFTDSSPIILSPIERDVIDGRLDFHVKLLYDYVKQYVCLPDSALSGFSSNVMENIRNEYKLNTADWRIFNTTTSILMNIFRTYLHLVRRNPDWTILAPDTLEITITIDT